MTTPAEELLYLNRARGLLRELANGPSLETLAVREKCLAALRHYPFQCNLERRYSDVCKHSGQYRDKPFCFTCNQQSD